MTNPAEPGPPIDQSAVTATRFTLTPLGRRGYQPDEVDEYLAHVAAELSQRDSREESLRAEADRYREALRDWQSRQSPRPADTAAAPDTDAVLQLAQAQQQAEEQLTQTREYCRELIEQARVQARQVVEQARHQAEEQSQRAAAEAEASGGDAEERETRLARARTSLAALTAAEERLREVREQLAVEVAQQEPQPRD